MLAFLRRWLIGNPLATGVEPTEVGVTVDGQHLTIKGARKATEAHAQGQYPQQEVR
jgi:HSP20 family molecular chaperone IbpA